MWQDLHLGVGPLVRQACDELGRNVSYLFLTAASQHTN
jgi:hypothetical protein